MAIKQMIECKISEVPSIHQTCSAILPFRPLNPRANPGLLDCDSAAFYQDKPTTVLVILVSPIIRGVSLQLFV
jgi:hypothetical protein